MAPTYPTPVHFSLAPDAVDHYGDRLHGQTLEEARIGSRPLMGNDGMSIKNVSTVLILCVNTPTPGEMPQNDIIFG